MAKQQKAKQESAKGRNSTRRNGKKWKGGKAPEDRRPGDKGYVNPPGTGNRMVTKTKKSQAKIKQGKIDLVNIDGKTVAVESAS